jgi:hypothetical protein
MQIRQVRMALGHSLTRTSSNFNLTGKFYCE